MRLPHHLHSYGSDALLLTWEQRIDPAISRSVHDYARAVLAHPGVVECVPAYASLLVRFSLRKTSAYQLREYIYALRPAAVPAAPSQRHLVPVCYDGPDLEYVQDTLQLSFQELVALHTGTDFLVYQLGYLPGFAFLGETPPQLEIERRSTPRPRVPSGAVGLAGRQTGIYPSPSPGGWQLIGRCPIPLLQAGPAPTRFLAGDTVRFYAIDAPAFLDLKQTPAPWPER